MGHMFYIEIRLCLNNMIEIIYYFCSDIGLREIYVSNADEAYKVC